MNIKRELEMNEHRLSKLAFEVKSIERFIKKLGFTEGNPQFAILMTNFNGFKSDLRFAHACSQEAKRMYRESVLN